MTSSNRADALIILLHGVGSSGDNMLGLASAWPASMPNILLVAPNAPFPFPQGGGRQWFSIAGVTEQDRPARIAAARADFDRTIRNELERYGFAERLDRVALVGFSQGSMMLLDAIATGRWPVAAAVAFAGRLATEPPFEPARATKLLLLHGADDSVVPPVELQRASTALKRAGMTLEKRLIPNVGHTISPEASRLAETFIRANLMQKQTA